MSIPGEFQQCPLCGVFHARYARHICDAHQMQAWHEEQERRRELPPVIKGLAWAAFFLLLRFFWWLYTGY